jgi:hypothetical protein
MSAFLGKRGIEFVRRIMAFRFVAINEVLENQLWVSHLFESSL